MRFAFVLLALACAKLVSAADSRPNIVFLLADDQAKYSMGCYDTPGAKTPNLDALASVGTTFDRHYVSTAICMASRATIMTGKYEYHAACNFDSGPMLTTIWQQTYPVLLKKSYDNVAFAGKFGFVVSDAPDGKGKMPEEEFDAWGGGPGQTSYETHRNESMKKYADEYPHSTLSYGAFSADFIQECAKGDAPFCLSISFKAPHHPTTPDPRFDEIYAGAKFVRPPNYGREHGEHFSKQSQQGRQYERFHSWRYANDYDQVMATYYQQIYAIDQVVGRIRNELADAGVDKNTVIIYTSDNGFLCGSHGYGSKVLPYEESTCVPLIVYDPRHESAGRAQRSDALTCNVDFSPTMLELAGVDLPDDMDGKSLLPLLDQTNQEHHASVPLINVWGPKAVHSFAIVSAQHKLIYWPYAEEGIEPRLELYDMQSDRLEFTDLSTDTRFANELSAMRAKMKQELQQWRTTGANFHGYPRFATIFDPDLPWADKSPLYGKK